MVTSHKTSVTGSSKVSHTKNIFAYSIDDLYLIYYFDRNFKYFNDTSSKVVAKLAPNQT